MARQEALRLAVLTSTLLSLQAPAASLHLSPVSLHMQAGQSAVGITLENQGDQPLTAQVRVFAWDQDLDEDHLSAQQQIQVSPPMSLIPPHSIQVVRVIRLDRSPVHAEQTYRLLIDELPDPAVHVDRAVDIRLRYSVPLFITPPEPPAGPVLTWQLSRHEGGLCLKVLNSGDTHAQISAVRILDSKGARVNVATGLLGYALAGRQREWPIPVQAAVQPLDAVMVEATVNQTSLRGPVVAATDSGR